MTGGPGWKALTIEEIEPIDWRGSGLRWHPLRAALGTRIAGMGLYTAPQRGGELVEDHREATDGRGHEELYVVLRGAALFTIGEQRIESGAGSFVLVRDPAVRRHAVATAPDSAVLALGGSPDFQPSASEWIERARPLTRTEPERARAILAELRAELPDSGGAEVGEALLAVARGDPERARAILARALERWPALREPLAGEPELGALLDDASAT